MSYADRDKYGMYKDTRHAGPGPALMGADTLIGDSVVNGKEENLGDIKEIMLDMQTGQVAYAVLAFGGFLGMGEKLFAVPWQALHLDTAHHRFVLNVDKERLKNAPGFDKDAWPDMSDVNWASGIHSFYGTDMDRPGAPSMGPGVAVGGMVGGASAGTGSSRMGSGMGSSMGSGSAGGGDLGSGSGLGGVGSGTSNAGMGSGAGGGSSNLGGSAGGGTAAGGSSYGPGGSADPRPGHDGDDKDLSRIRGSNIG
ncbi:PRC-barrel domain-containing protein [Massilia sp. AB1]|uniref:PRC-barrel domain-containing protein n=1 Tax=Massilia sp. AB1 TaxID=2823371 RepID=UPI001B845351|nr:PRC-barrel domain-containing protein [Massilia sp. AB1]MBQ5940259.1 PRC-barrel domain-containing protein [Massilia sp. AB1]